MVWPLAFFRNNRHVLAYSTDEQKQLNNHAMKFLRDMMEHPAGVPYRMLGAQEWGLDLTFPYWNVSEVWLPQIIHGGDQLKTPQSWSFEYNGPSVQWSWQRMLASFTDEDLGKLAGRGGGIVGCKLMPRLGSYDHLRTTLRITEGRPFPKDVVCPVWDFVIFSSTGDATGVRPKWGKRDFDIHYYVRNGSKVFGENATGTLLAPPGMSAGRGTYKYYKQKTIDDVWRQIPASETHRPLDRGAMWH